MDRRRMSWAATGVVLAAFALRVFNLGTQSLWYDEGFSANLARQGLGAITTGELNPPLYHYLLHFWLALAGSGEFALRFFSLAAGLLAIPLVFRLGSRLFGIRAGWLAALLVAIAPFHLRYSQEARMYALAATLVLFSNLALLRALARNRRADWLAYAASSLAAVYTHYYAFLVLGAQAVFVVVWAAPAIVRRMAGRPVGPGSAFSRLLPGWRLPLQPAATGQPPAGSAGETPAAADAASPRPRWRFPLSANFSREARGVSGAGITAAPPRSLRLPSSPAPFASWLLCCAGMGLAYLPWLPFLIDHYAHQNVSYWPGVLSLDFLAERTLRSFTATSNVPDPLGIGIAVAYLALAALSFWPGRPRQRAEAPFLQETGLVRAFYPALLLLIPVFLAFVLVHDRPKFSPRYLLVAWPAFMLLVAGGLARGLPESRQALRRLWDGAGRPWRRAARSTAALVAVVALLGVTGSLADGAQRLYFDSRYAKDDWRSVAHYLQANAGVDETILLLSGHAYPVFTYYYPRDNWYPVPAHSAPSPSVEDVLTFDIVPELNRVLTGKKGVWLVLWQDEVVDPNAVVTTAFDAAFQARPVRTRFQGIRLMHYRIPPSAELPATMPFGAVSRFEVGEDETLAGYVQLTEEPHAGSYLDVLLNWHARRATDTIYKLSLRLLDPEGEERAQLDARLAGFWYPTNRWKPGEVVAARHRLKIPSDTPPGTYRLEMIVYRAADGWFVNRIDLGPVTVGGYDGQLDPGRVDIANRLSVPVGELRLAGFAVDRATAGPGERVLLDLLWQAPAHVRSDYQLRVQMGENFSFLLASDYPTSQWAAGTVVRTRHRLVVPAGAAPGELPLRIGLLGPEGRPAGDLVSLANLRVTSKPRDFAAPIDISQPRQATFGDQARLLGYALAVQSGSCQVEVRDLQPYSPRPSGEQGVGTSIPRPTSNPQPPTSHASSCILRLTLYWQAAGEVTTSYTVFTHLLDPSNKVAAQHDGLPAGGEWPTTGWVSGQVIVDTHDLVLGSGQAAGRYVLEAGLYDARTGARAPVTDESGQRQPDDRLLLASVEIR